MKVCSKCKESKQTGEFSKYARSRDGLRSQCKGCAKTESAAYRAAYPEKVKARKAAYQANNREKTKAAFAAWYAANSERVKASQSAYYAANLVKCKANKAAWRKANPDRCKAFGAAWQKANPEKVRVKTAAWAKANPELRRITAHNYNARKRENGGKLSKGLADKLLISQRGMCVCCNQPLGDNFHLDHILPIALGGSNTDDNIQLLRARCNLQKRAVHPIDFMQSRGFLL